MTTATTDRDRRFHAILGAYFEAAGVGPEPDRAAWIALHPEFAADLAAFFADQDRVRDLAAPLAPPSPPHGEYELIRELGRGGMGVVYEAWQVGLRRRVALKVLPSAAALDPVRLGRFQVEAQAAARLRHANIIPVFSVGCEGGVYYYAMQLIEGVSLADRIRELRGEGEAPPAPGPGHHRWVARLGVQAADALDHAHREGVVHRDVKPSNLMVDAAGALWVADFGLARLEDDAGLTRAGDLLGTLRYMSPEQSSGDPARVDARTDVYSLGATLYELLTLRPARVAADRDALLAEIGAGEPRPPRSLDRAIPRDLETIVLKATAREPAARYPTAGAMAEDLRRFLDGLPILARRPSPLARAAGWAGRRKAPVAAVVLAGLMAAASFAALALASRNRDFARAQRRADRARDIAQAGRYAYRNNLDEAVRLLSPYIPEPGAEGDRDFAWHHLWRFCHVGPRRLKGHEGHVYFAEYSPDGRALATCGADATIRLWDAETGSPLRTFRGHEGDVDCVAFSPDGRTLASGGDDGSIRLWDADDGAKPCRILARTGVEVVAILFTPDGKSLLSGDAAGVVTSWDLASGGVTRSARIHGRRIEGMALAPDGETLATAGEGCKLVAASTLAVRAHVLPGRPVQAVAAGPDSTTFAAGDSIGGVAVVRGGAPDAKDLHYLGVVQGLAFSPDGRSLAACGDSGELKVWDLVAGSAPRVLRSGSPRHWKPAFSRDGRRLAAGGIDGIVEVWDLERSQDFVERRAPFRIIPQVRPRLDGTRLTVVGAREGHEEEAAVLDWNFLRGEVATAGSIRLGGLYVAEFSARGEALAAQTSTDPSAIQLLARASGWAPARLPFPSGWPPTVPGKVSLAWSDDGRLLAASSWRRGLAVWDAKEGRPIGSPACDVGPALGFLPGAERLTTVVAGRFGVRQAGGAVVQQIGGLLPEYTDVSSASADGRIVVLGPSIGGVLTIVDRRAGTMRADSIELDREVSATALSPDGSLFAVGRPDGSVAVRDLAQSATLLDLRGPEAPVRLLRFSPDGSALHSLHFDDQGRSASLVTWPAGPDATTALPGR